MTRYPLLIAFLAVLLCLGFRSADEVKNFKLPNLDNEEVELKTLLAKGPVLIDFWATWCKPCIRAFPELEALYQKYKDQGFTIIGLNEDSPRNRNKVKPFVENLKVTFPILIDKDNQVMRDQRVQVLPTTILLAQDGTVVLRETGYRPGKIEALGKKIADLLPAKKK